VKTTDPRELARKAVAALDRDVLLMLEHLMSPDEYPEGVNHICKVAGTTGVALG
jgi:hypothetical protein